MLDRHLEALYEQQVNLAETISFVGNKMGRYQEKMTIYQKGCKDD